MKVRYKQGQRGPEAVAKVFEKNEHLINLEKIDKDALSVIEKLQVNGFETYLVGGAVRDLLCGKIPKDFDVVTAASPRQVHKLFYNSRIIGRRFKIVHVFFGMKIIEVSTFRSVNDHADSYDTSFGTIDEDATRRDFSINSLYFDPSNETIIDFNNAFEDFRLKRIRSIIPLNYTFIEDPVRMIRAVKCHISTGFRLKRSIIRAIKYYSPYLSYVSSSRMTEEVNKILTSGNSMRITKELVDYRLFSYILPSLSVYSKTNELYDCLNELDRKINFYKEKNNLNFDKSILYYYLSKSFVIINPDLKKPSDIFKDVFRQIKILISPNTPPNIEIEKAAYMILKDKGIKYYKPNKAKTSAHLSKKHD